MISYKSTLAGDFLYSSTSDRTSPIIKQSNRLIDKDNIITTKGGSFDQSYTISIPSCMNVLSLAFKNLHFLSNEPVKKQTAKLLITFQTILDLVYKNNNLANRLPALNLIEREDKSALVEWNFENYRIGFALEEDEKESNYFVVSQDRYLHQFVAETYLLGDNYDSIVSSLISYVIRNS